MVVAKDPDVETPLSIPGVSENILGYLGEQSLWSGHAKSGSTNKELSAEQSQNHSLDTKLTKEEVSTLENIKSNVKTKVLTESDPTQSKPVKPKPFTEKIKQEKSNKSSKGAGLSY